MSHLVALINFFTSHVILLNINVHIPFITENYERHNSRHQKCQDKSTAQICNERFANVRIFGSFTEKCLFCDKHFKLIQFSSWKSIILKKREKHQKSSQSKRSWKNWLWNIKFRYSEKATKNLKKSPSSQKSQNDN